MGFAFHGVALWNTRRDPLEHVPHSLVVLAVASLLHWPTPKSQSFREKRSPTRTCTEGNKHKASPTYARKRSNPPPGSPPPAAPPAVAPTTNTRAPRRYRACTPGPPRSHAGPWCNTRRSPPAGRRQGDNPHAPNRHRPRPPHGVAAGRTQAATTMSPSAACPPSAPAHSSTHMPDRAHTSPRSPRTGVRT